jgi:hypothetical protein
MNNNFSPTNIQITQPDLDEIRNLLKADNYHMVVSPNLSDFTLKLNGIDHRPIHWGENQDLELAKTVLQNFSRSDMGKSSKIEIFLDFSLCKLEDELFCKFEIKELPQYWDKSITMERYFEILELETKNTEKKIDFEKNYEKDFRVLTLTLDVPESISYLSDAVSYCSGIFLGILKRANEVAESVDKQVETVLRSPKKHTTFRLSDEAQRQIKSLSFHEGRSEAMIVEMAIQEYYNRHFD